MYISVPLDTTFCVVFIISCVITWIIETIKEKKIEVEKYTITKKSNIIENLKSINSTYNVRFMDNLNDYYITCGKYETTLAHVKNENEIIYETNNEADIKLLKEFAKIYNLKTFEEYKQENEKADKIQAIIIIFLTLLLYGFVIYKVW